MDIGNALQGLFTISVGSLLGISALHLNIRTGDHINQHGNGNIAIIIKNNLFPHGTPVPGLQFRVCFFLLCAAAIAFPAVSPLLVTQCYWLGVVMIPLSVVGVKICQHKTHAAVYFIATLMIAWLAIRDNTLMAFAADNGPQLRPLLDQLFDQYPSTLLDFVWRYGPAILADLITVICLCAFVMLQVWIGLAFLTNVGTYENAFRLGFFSVVSALPLVCVVSGALAAMVAPWLIWPNATMADVNPLNMLHYGYFVLAHTFSII